ncbi:hypothetical protein BDN70DRAFT_803975 [Pholiota conissans]|uniref:Transcription factor CBF/NF-Y/archaeal histone domain-containing protein n=1 Tax=Pholiota conissans TaxID=109636 RepID=A0A9P6CUZ7_9AGAR|nr:hypothetical protein BDN70DRAFT_803975 [Pholiota conissans]
MAAPYYPHELPVTIQAEQAQQTEQYDDSDVEAELEVDQLDSDTDPEADAAKPSVPKNGNALRPGERIPGHTLLPGVRLENIIQADGVTGNLALSKEGLYVLSIATEEFIKRLIQAAHREASAHRRNQINYTDMATTAQQYQEFMILADTIPIPVTLADAFMLRQDKERELLEDNPALAIPYSNMPSAVPSPDPEPMMSHPRPQKKSRSSTTNGKEREKTNGNSSSKSKHGMKKSSRQDYDTLYPDISAPNGHLQWPNHVNGMNGPEEGHYRRSSRNGISSASTPSLPPPIMNGHPTRPSWPGQFTGPASGFLAPAVPYGPGRAPQNPGRTIYSQSHRPD